MTSIWAAAVLFGFVYPGSKWIMQLGVALFPFCLLYVGLRLCVQFPFVLFNGDYRIGSRKSFLLLCSLGLVGACLQTTEFVGISHGLPVPLVSFLVYSHPAWTLLISRFLNQERLTRTAILKLALAIFGIGLITGVGTTELGYSWTLLFWPLAAGFFIALWICLASYASKMNCGSRTMSFYYDLFAFLALLLVGASGRFGSPMTEAFHFIAVPTNFAAILIYSTGIGLLPNLLFYSGSKHTSAFSAGLILLLEPVIATFVSYLVWDDHLDFAFFLGAFAVLCTNLPLAELAGVLRPRKLTEVTKHVSPP